MRTFYKNVIVSLMHTDILAHYYFVECHNIFLIAHTFLELYTYVASLQKNIKKNRDGFRQTKIYL